jgi:antagonist of KipI
MSVTVTKEGVFSSVQGLGQRGLQRFGINPRGAMDALSLRNLNMILGNPDDAPGVEIHFPAGEFRFDEAHYFAVGGADLVPELDDSPIENWRVYRADPCSQLRFRRKLSGERAYLAIRGGVVGLEVPPGHRKAAKYATERLLVGDTLLIRDTVGLDPPVRRRAAAPRYPHGGRIRVVPGGEFGSLSDDGRALFGSSAFRITNTSDRMGYRLEGPPLAIADRAEMVSAAVDFGTVQLLPDGQLVILMADHQTAGGYPCIGGVIGADLPVLAQSGPGSGIHFETVSVEEAEAAMLQADQDLRWLRTGCRLATDRWGDV